MKELVSVPTSIRQRLEQAQSLTRQNRPDEAREMLRAAGVELARSQPELCALLIAGKLGSRGFSYHEHEVIMTVVKEPVTFLGFQIGERNQVVPLHRSTTKTWRLF